VSAVKSRGAMPMIRWGIAALLVLSGLGLTAPEAALSRPDPEGSPPTSAPRPAPASFGAPRVVLGQACTALDAPDPGSRANVRLAATRLTRVEVPPRSEFRFLEALRVRGGVPDEPGRALLDGAVVEEPGGGLCQVAGTVYAAALRAGLGVIERAGHSAAVRTLPAGLDAAVSEAGGTDLVLWNAYRFPVRLELKAGGGKLEARWTADSPGVPARVGRAADGALVRRLPDGREELLSPAPTSVVSQGSARRADRPHDPLVP